MKKITLGILTLLLLMLGQLEAQQKLSTETDAQKEQRMAWWLNDRFGMFIHWGLYSLPARHEWVKSNERITDSAYQKYFDNFNPDLYNPREWARMAKAAGMKYAVLTTKHHEGFCLFDSKFTEYKSTNTAIRKDLVKEWVEAFRAEGLKVGFYYSLIDWHHPDYTIDNNHPQRPKNPADYDKLNKGRDMAKYRTYLHNQVKELMTNYGKIDILWLDFSFPGEHGKDHNDWGSEELLKMVRKLQPGIIVDDRLDLNNYDDGFDFVTPEQYKVSEWPMRNGKKVHWETCQTFSGSWGYYRDETSWKDNKQLLVLLIESVSKGGNLLLNVGPTSRGLFDYRAQKALAGMGDWMTVNSRAIYGCTQAPADIQRPENSLLTYNPVTKRLYVHLLDYPLQRFELPGMKGKIKYAQFLHDGSEIKMRNTDKGDVALDLPVLKPNVEIPVIELVLE
ncbi:alpha-L-fucosidase [Chitinophaga dinghuensis]|uniref:alpha-L-fucosidase n=1 Tax=Chitinophaga dinghuensis TaxID=1539050 RepID=A0A327WCQ8_9BACT|nr:alpha-L-fucosidase [Chitinophaga dinghuensis]RAJ87341.1 alpha-L-fucosidase [Chitinophaga dinghuensis]